MMALEKNKANILQTLADHEQVLNGYGVREIGLFGA